MHRMHVSFDSLASKLQRKMVVSVKTVNWEEAGKKLEFSILIRLASDRSIWRNLMEDRLTNVWKIQPPPKFLKVGRDMVLVSFDSEKDQLKIITGGPCSFYGSAIIMEKWMAGMTEEDFDNSKLNIWVQIRRLPFEFRCYRYAKGVAQFAGDLVCTDDHEGNKWNQFGHQYVRVRLRVDSNTPMVPGLFLKRPNQKPTWISFKYEKLPKICYNYGLLNHETKNCTVHLGVNQKSYGNWIRAEDPEIFYVFWSEKMAEDGVYSLISLPEVDMKPPSGDGDFESSREIADTSSILNIAAGIPEDLKRCVSNGTTEMGGNTTVINGRSNVVNIGPIAGLGFEAILPLGRPLAERIKK